MPDDEECIAASKERAYYTVGMLAGSCLLTTIISGACCYCKYKRDMENEKRDAGRAQYLSWESEMSSYEGESSDGWGNDSVVSGDVVEPNRNRQR